MVVTALICLVFLLFYTLFAVYTERKIAAFIQDRIGPYEVGYKGLLQPLADVLKAIQKEDFCPFSRYPWLFRLAPVWAFVLIVGAFAFLPWQNPGLPNSTFWLLSVLTLHVFAFIQAGLGTNTTLSLLGAFRSIGQFIAYEVPMGFCLVCVAIATGSLNLHSIAMMQQNKGMIGWNIIQMPLLIPVFLLFFIGTLAQSHRIPFNLPEAESELVAGYHTEYTGLRWALFMLAEYGILFLLSLMSVWIFWGAGYPPWHTLNKNIDIAFLLLLLIKTYALIGMSMWIRWTLPRIRQDQLIGWAWSIFMPIAIALVAIMSIWRLWRY